MKKLVLLFAIALGISIPAAAQTCTPSAGPANQHWTSLCWTASTTTGGGITYSVYRATGTCASNPVLTKLTTTALAVLNFLDVTVTAGTSYCYAVTASQGGLESGFSPTTGGTIPLTFPPSPPSTGPSILVQ